MPHDAVPPPGARPEDTVDLERPSVARMYDYLLGGSHNFAVDRQNAEQLLRELPHARTVAAANRAFLGRVVQWCLEEGIDQFLDLGSGIPTVGNVHEIAPSARVAYVEIEPVAVAHARRVVADVETATMTAADLRDVDAVLGAPGVAGLLNLTRPVALLAVAVLHFLPEDPAPVLAAYRAALAPGSVLAISHGSADHDDPELAEQMCRGAGTYRSSGSSVVLRSREELLAMLDGWEPVEPGLVDVARWPDPARAAGSPLVGGYGVVARRV